MPYGQAGRRAIVYQVLARDDNRALKVFKQRFRTPAIALAAQSLAPYASLPGLEVCQRQVVSPELNSALVEQYPDLSYAVLMPWIEGPTWMETMMAKRALSRPESLATARSLAETLVRMEQEGLAHCDLSGPNTILPRDDGVALVDVEEMYGPGLERPDVLPSGTPGYTHQMARHGLWGPDVDRFAGAMLLAEILGWCDERAREAAWGESFFPEDEIHKGGSRYQLLIAVLTEQWDKAIAELFERAWLCESMADCPAPGNWLAALPDEVQEGVSDKARDEPRPCLLRAEPDPTFQSLVSLSRQFEERGEYRAALEAYRQALALAPRESSLAKELAVTVDRLERQLQPQDELLSEEVKEQLAEPQGRIPAWVWALALVALVALAALVAALLTG
jgi:hypothetical protein